MIPLSLLLVRAAGDEFPFVATTVTQDGLTDGVGRYGDLLADALAAAANSTAYTWGGSQSCSHKVSPISCPPGPQFRQYALDLECPGCGVFYRAMPQPQNGGLLVRARAKTSVSCSGGEVRVGLCCKHFGFICEQTCSAGTITFKQDWEPMSVEYNVTFDASTRLLTPDPGSPAINMSFNIDKNIISGCWLSHKDELSGFVGWIMGDLAGELKQGVLAALSAGLTEALDTHLNNPIAITMNTTNATMALAFSPALMTFYPNRSNLRYDANISVTNHKTGQAVYWLPTPAQVADAPPLDGWWREASTLFPDNVSAAATDGPDYKLLAATRVSLSALQGLMWAGDEMGLYHYAANVTVKDGNLSTLLEWTVPVANFTSQPDGEGQVQLLVTSGRCTIICKSQCSQCSYNNTMFDFTFGNVSVFRHQADTHAHPQPPAHRLRRSALRFPARQQDWAGGRWDLPSDRLLQRQCDAL